MQAVHPFGGRRGAVDSAGRVCSPAAGRHARSGPCSLATATPYSGSIEWRAVADGRLVIRFEHGEVLVGADTQVLSPNRDKLVLPFCGEDDVDEYVVFSGGPRSN